MLEVVGPPVARKCETATVDDCVSKNGSRIMRMTTLSRVFEFRGYLEDPSGSREIFFWIEAPRQTPGEGDFYCEIGGSLFGKPIKIYGEDGEQAVTLAYSLVRKVTGKKLLDKSRTPIDLPDEISS